MLPLRIYISATCLVCEHTRELVDQIRTLRPAYPVELIDLDQQPTARPDFVFGTPTYVLGETIIALGNPELSTLLRFLDRAIFTSG
ncbi:MAG: hypothetical protein J7456_12930 [Chloroflexus sp.]|jgi:hypothetical protein|nr:hypothetical protein [Chloroflexus sp.]MBO9319411.1 hypothetical protein [Chloroflexus sp.]MBO9349345.1 hypothetical protein [Chloroflexus sp.]